MDTRLKIKFVVRIADNKYRFNSQHGMTRLIGEQSKITVQVVSL